MIKIKNPKTKIILTLIGIPILGFILLNLTFLLDFFFQTILRGIVGLFIPFGPETDIRWLPPFFHVSFIILISIISLCILKSKLNTFIKATYLMVPVAVVLATIGIFTYQWPMITYIICIPLILLLLFTFYRTRQPWLYYYSTLLVSITLAMFTLAGGEI